ncbi:hypothetical protein PG987_004509 [Apiospora arundinis]
MDDTPALAGDASRAADGEKNMTLRDALQVGKKGILWAIVCASSTVMEGFDLALLGGFYAYPAFQVSPYPYLYLFCYVECQKTIREGGGTTS